MPKSRPQTTFDAEQWKIIPDTETRRYANVSNTLSVALESGEYRSIPIVVPTELFTFMREVLKVERTEEVALYLIEEVDWFVFGIVWGFSENNYCDLWAYPKSDPPAFLNYQAP